MTKKLKKAELEKLISRSVVGFVIPMLSIPKLYRELETAAKAGATEEAMKAIVAGFAGVKVA